MEMASQSKTNTETRRPRIATPRPTKASVR
jgi:hypothetical protein